MKKEALLSTYCARSHPVCLLIVAAPDLVLVCVQVLRLHTQLSLPRAAILDKQVAIQLHQLQLEVPILSQEPSQAMVNLSQDTMPDLSQAMELLLNPTNKRLASPTHNSPMHNPTNMGLRLSMPSSLGRLKLAILMELPKLAILMAHLRLVLHMALPRVGTHMGLHKRAILMALLKLLTHTVLQTHMERLKEERTSSVHPHQVTMAPRSSLLVRHAATLRPGEV